MSAAVAQAPLKNLTYPSSSTEGSRWVLDPFSGTRADYVPPWTGETPANATSE